MPLVNWDKFEQLPGSTQYNFEMLCRALIRRHYGRYGQFVARANQPGVEFHLKLHSACALGNPSAWFGWQCRWYDLPSGRPLGTVRLSKIKKAIATTEKELPDLTDWVLWTRRPLTKGDQKLFYGLKTHMRLHLWTSAEIEEHLSGDAEILRGTYFGELVLTPDKLATLHEVSVAPIRRRWQPEVHQTIDAERALRKMLFETETWDDLRMLANQLETDATAIDSDVSDLTGALLDATTEMASLARVVAVALADAHTVLSRGDLDLLQQQLANLPAVSSQKLSELPRQLRACRHHSGLTITNALADVRRAPTILEKVATYLSKRIIGVVADAGCGKTQLAAQLTATVNDRPSGILLHGRDLHAGHTLDDLARHIVIQGNQVPSMEALVAAVDASGQRAKQRLPIVIDGLNEAEDPRDWQGPLSSLHETLRQYPYVLFICTLRTVFADEALPKDIDRLEIPDFGQDAIEAIQRYFDYYQINPADAELPMGLLSHPLTLRLFCEVTNPTRKSVVGIEAMPGSLDALFDRYLKQAAERITELAPRTRRYYEQDVFIALYEIGKALWEQHTRSFDERDLRQCLGDDTRPWNESIVRALEQEGVVLRIPGEPPGAIHVTAVYDALAGHLMANTMITKHGRSGLQEYLRDSDTLAALAGPLPDQYPLATDTFRSLVGLVPRRLTGQQLWQLLDEPLRTAALSWACELEGDLLDAQTVEELATLIAKPPNRSPDPFDRLWHTRGAPAHPLNAEFLDTVLRPMAAADRDLRWTEWIRHNQENLHADLQRLEKGWRNRTDRSLTDRLRARWVMWTLTSSVRDLRDHATRTLYWFGRGDPDALFNLTLAALAINDPCVPERLMAASYGIAMALQHDESFVNNSLLRYAKALFDYLFSKNAQFATTHILMRDYAKHTIDIALLHNSNLLNSRERMRIKPPFKNSGIKVWGESEDKNKDEYRDGNYPFGFDFNNYTIGYLIPKRRNYDFNDPEYLKVKANLWWRIYGLGYSLEKFGEVDKKIAAESFYRYGQKENRGKTDRYGKKYCWIAYYEIAGFRQDKGLLKREWESDDCKRFTIDIDPSFPDEIQNVEIIRTDFLKSRLRSLPKWITKGPVPDISPYLLLDDIQNEHGPWVLIDGFILQENLDTKRDIFIFPRGLFVKKEDFTEVVQRLRKQDLGGRWLPEIPEHHYTFAGEVPWCETFFYNGNTELSFVVGIEKKRVPFEKTEFLKDGKSLTVDELKELFEIVDNHRSKKISEEDLNKYIEENNINTRKVRCFKTEMVQKVKEYEVVIPISTLNLGSHESIVNPGMNAYVLSKELCELLDLTSRPQTFDLYDKNDRKASITLRWGEAFHTFHKLIYLRQDLLDKVLQEKAFELIWGIWGERRYKSKDNVGLFEFSKKHKAYKVFQSIVTYG